jgi:hypothetical protein
MTNLNKEIASFIQLFTRKGLLKRKNNSSFSFLIKMETYNIEKIEFLKQNSKTKGYFNVVIIFKN